MLQRAAAAVPEMPARRRHPRALLQHLDELGRPAFAALLAERCAHAVARRGERHIDLLPAALGDAVAARADAADDEDRLLRRSALPSHALLRAAAIRNSIFPSGPRIGLSVRPTTRQPGWAASQSRMRSHTSR